MLVIGFFASKPVTSYGWAHRIQSTLTADGGPISGEKRVVAIDPRTLFVGGALISNPDGTFLFRGLPALPVGHPGWMLVANDNLITGEAVDGTYNATVMDMVQPSAGA